MIKTIRGGTIADLDTIVGFNRAMAEETEGLALDEHTLRAGVAAVLEGREPGAYHVMEIDGRVVAQLMITYEWSDWRNRVVWWIQSVYVAPDARAGGRFRELFEHVAAEARRAGAAGLRLYVDQRNRRAQAVYAALGMNGDHYRVFEMMFSS